MNKKEAAEKLGVSIRLVERYASEGRLGEVTYIRGRTGKQADYSEEVVEQLRQELEAPVTAVNASVGMARIDAQRGLAEVFSRLLDGSSVHTRGASVRTSEMLLLSPREAAHLANLPISYIKAAIKENRLPVRRIGRAQRIKREDLDSFVRDL
jgi:excisionase family DNA binding protein